MFFQGFFNVLNDNFNFNFKYLQIENMFLQSYSGYFILDRMIKYILMINFFLKYYMQIIGIAVQGYASHRLNTFQTLLQTDVDHMMRRIMHILEYNICNVYRYTHVTLQCILYTNFFLSILFSLVGLAIVKIYLLQVHLLSAYSQLFAMFKISLVESKCKWLCSEFLSTCLVII